MLMKKLLVVGLVVGVSASLVAQDDDSPPPPLQLEAHEWGVWKIENGRVTIDDLAEESPRFVYRTPAAPQQPVPQVTIQNATVRKPVLFLRANRPIDDLRVTVRFVGGRPWLYYPEGEVRGNRLSFRGQLSNVPDPQRLLTRDGRGDQGFPRGHWWQHLRNAGGNTFTSSTNGAEKFIFYDGPVRFRAPVITRGENLRTRRGERRVWVVENGEYVESVATPRELRETLRGQVSDLRGRLDDQLQRAGLNAAEAASLLGTWEPELNDNARHLIYLLTRAEYDRMLPITISPTPTELVRVGVVISEL